MSKPQVTITLGRSGQKVVKRPQVTSNGSRADSQPISGSKRSMRERLDSNADTTMSSINKRLRGNASTRIPGSNRVEGAHVGRNDLRLKLTRKRLSRRIQHEVEERKKMELRQKMSRTVRSPEGLDRGNLRHILPTKRTSGLLMMDPLRSYSSWASEGLVPESSDRGRRTSPPRNIDELRIASSARSIDASRTGRLMGGDVSDPRSKRPTTITMRSTLDSNKPVSELLPASGGAPRSSYMGEQPLTVTSLLHSLGLGKYAVQFQAEEVDMTVLKQMGDNDLKELGIPMGPRKKILLAVLPPPKKRQFVATTY